MDLLGRRRRGSSLSRLGSPFIRGRVFPMDSGRIPHWLAAVIVAIALTLSGPTLANYKPEKPKPIIPKSDTKPDRITIPKIEPIKPPNDGWKPGKPEPSMWKPASPYSTKEPPPRLDAPFGPGENPGSDLPEYRDYPTSSNPHPPTGRAAPARIVR